MLRESHSIDVYLHYLVTPDGRRLELASSGGSRVVRDAIGTTLEFGAAVSGVVAEQRRSIYLNSVQERHDPMTAYIRSVGGRCCACYPLLANGRILGTLSVGSTTRNSLEPRELELFSLIAEQLALATERRRQISQLQELERLATAGRMSATLAHEINNPLHSLFVHLEGLREHVHSPEAACLLDKVSSQVNQLADITRRTLQTFRGRSGSMVRCNLSELAQEIILDARLPGHARLTSSIEPSVSVYAVPGELQQVIFNLLLNAAQFTPAGREIRLELHRNATSAQLHILDQGPGIPSAIQDRIFQPFFTTRGNEGTGIGLWHSREIVRRMGGDLTFASCPELRPGANFTVTLPLAA